MGKASVLMALIIGGVACLFIVEALNINTTILRNTGIIKSNVGVYWDSQCTNQTTEIDWGELFPGETTNVQLYVENGRNTTMTLTLSTDKWIPSEAMQYITLDWDYDYQPINPYEAYPVKLILTVSSTIEDITNFSFDILVTGNW